MLNPSTRLSLSFYIVRNAFPASNLSLLRPLEALDEELLITQVVEYPTVQIQP